MGRDRAQGGATPAGRRRVRGRTGAQQVTAWLDGALVPLEQARVSVLDHGLVVGDGVFETLRVYRGVPFAWSRHLARLRLSAGGLGLVVPDDDHLRGAADGVLEANRLREA